MVAGLRLIRRVEHAVEVPLARVAGCVARGTQHPGQRDFAGAQVDLGALGDPSVHAVPIGGSPREDCGARGAAHSACSVALGEFYAFFGKRIEMGRLNSVVPKAAQIAVTQVVREEDHQVRRLCMPFRGRSGCSNQSQEPDNGEAAGHGAFNPGKSGRLLGGFCPMGWFPKSAVRVRTQPCGRPREATGESPSPAAPDPAAEAETREKRTRKKLCFLLKRCHPKPCVSLNSP